MMRRDREDRQKEESVGEHIYRPAAHGSGNGSPSHEKSAAVNLPKRGRAESFHVDKKDIPVKNINNTCFFQRI